MHDLTGLTEQEVIDVKRGPAHYKVEVPIEKWKLNAQQRIDRLAYAASLNIPHLPQLIPHKGTCAVVGAAPTVTKYFDQIRQIQQNEINLVMPVNGAHTFLIENNIIPNISVLFEVDDNNPEAMLGSKPHDDVTYYVCSHCDQGVFRGLEGYKRVLWHCFDEPPEYQMLIGKLFPNEFMVGGGFVTFFRVINIAIILGYRKFELFGCDGSFEGDRSHIEGYHSYAGEQSFEVLAGGVGLPLKRFKTNPSLSFMTHEFLRFCEAQHTAIKIKVHGEGLIRYLHQQVYPEVYKE